MPENKNIHPSQRSGSPKRHWTPDDKARLILVMGISGMLLISMTFYIQTHDTALLLANSPMSAIAIPAFKYYFPEKKGNE